MGFWAILFIVGGLIFIISLLSIAYIIGSKKLMLEQQAQTEEKNMLRKQELAEEEKLKQEFIEQYAANYIKELNVTGDEAFLVKSGYFLYARMLRELPEYLKFKKVQKILTELKSHVPDDPGNSKTPPKDLLH